MKYNEFTRGVVQSIQDGIKQKKDNSGTYEVIDIVFLREDDQLETMTIMKFKKDIAGAASTLRAGDDVEITRGGDQYNNPVAPFFTVVGKGDASAPPPPATGPTSAAMAQQSQTTKSSGTSGGSAPIKDNTGLNRRAALTSVLATVEFTKGAKNPERVATVLRLAEPMTKFLDGTLTADQAATVVAEMDPTKPTPQPPPPAGAPDDEGASAAGNTNPPAGDDEIPF